MTRSQQKPRSGKMRSWVKYVLLFFIGGGTGVGGWQLKDHPILQKLVSQFLQKQGVDGELGDGQGLRKVAKLLTHADAYITPGTFEVSVKDLAIQPGQFKPGQAVDLQVRLLKRGAEGRDRIVWDSKGRNEDSVEATREGLHTGWADSPFDVEWTPGDTFVLEVWEHRKIFGSRKKFEWVSDSAKIFPLRSGTFDLSLFEQGAARPGTSDNQLTIASRPKSEAAARAKFAERDEDDVRIK